LRALAYLSGVLVGVFVVDRLLTEWPLVEAGVLIVLIILVSMLSAHINEREMNDELRRRFKQPRDPD
jgi:uncharacterized membrane protein YfcA